MSPDPVSASVNIVEKTENENENENEYEYEYEYEYKHEHHEHHEHHESGLPRSTRSQEIEIGFRVFSLAQRMPMPLECACAFLIGIYCTHPCLHRYIRMDAGRAAVNHGIALSIVRLAVIACVCMSVCLYAVYCILYGASLLLLQCCSLSFLFRTLATFTRVDMDIDIPIGTGIH